jgi:polyhydroxyalkanoate synthesis regulator phasin
LNTFDSFEEAKAFVDDFVKPDYNNWESAEEFETRFMEIVEKKFS